MSAQQPGLSLQLVHERLNKLRKEVAAAEASLAELEASLASLEIDASQVVSGTLDIARIPNLDAAKITTGALTKARQHAQTAYTDQTNVFTEPQVISRTTSPILYFEENGVFNGEVHSTAGNLYIDATGAHMFRSMTGTPRVVFQTNGAIRERGRSLPMGEWTIYTPTVLDVNLGTGGSLIGRYSYVAGKTVAYEIVIILGTGGSVTGLVHITTPTPHRAVAVAGSYGDVTIYDADANMFYEGKAMVTASPFLYLAAPSLAGLTPGNPFPLNPVTATFPITFAPNDQIYIRGVYEEA